MTIDEANKKFNDVAFYTSHFNKGMNVYLLQEDVESILTMLEELKDIKNKYEAQTDVIEQMERELNWWREQALIDRGDVIGEFATCLVECPPKTTCKNCLYKRIKELPKAKPPISQNLVENSQEIVKDCNGCFGASFGDCETCKHYDEPCCKTCGDGADYYEPYIPKEKE